MVHSILGREDHTFSLRKERLQRLCQQLSREISVRLDEDHRQNGVDERKEREDDVADHLQRGGRDGAEENRQQDENERDEDADDRRRGLKKR